MLVAALRAQVSAPRNVLHTVILKEAVVNYWHSLSVVSELKLLVHCKGGRMSTREGIYLNWEGK